MNLPNKLTVIRCVMAPLFLVIMLCPFPFHYGISLVVFSVAALTDMFDGRIARSRGLITNLGKFLDPLADKMLTTSAFLGFMVTMDSFKMSLCWAVMLILTREFMVTSVRLLAAKDGVVIAASMAGKVKTVMQFAAILYNLAALQVVELLPSNLAQMGTILTVIGVVLIWIAVVLTIVSGFQYVWACRRYFQDN